MTDLNDVYLANPITEIKSTDLAYLLDDPGGTPAHGAIQALNLLGGWIGVRDAWTYASAYTINVPAGATSLYQKGWGVRFKQSGGTYKFGYLTGVASALLTVAGGSDYVVANEAITDVAIAPNPANAFGFPDIFNYTVALTGTGGTQPSLGNGVLNGIQSIRGKFVEFAIYFVPGSTTTFGDGQFRFSFPAPNPLSALTYADIGPAAMLDAGTMNYYGFWYNAGSGVLGVLRDNTTQPASFNIPMTWAQNDILSLNGRYRYAT